MINNKKNKLVVHRKTKQRFKSEWVEFASFTKGKKKESLIRPTRAATGGTIKNVVPLGAGTLHVSVLNKRFDGPFNEANVCASLLCPCCVGG